MSRDSHSPYAPPKSRQPPLPPVATDGATFGSAAWFRDGIANLSGLAVVACTGAAILTGRTIWLLIVALAFLVQAILWILRRSRGSQDRGH